MAKIQLSPAETLPDFLVCPNCRGELYTDGEDLSCLTCAAIYHRRLGIPMLLAADAAGEDTERVQALYDEVADHYDQVFAAHVSEHYLRKRLRVIQGLAGGGRVLDVGCGTGALAARVAAAGYQVFGVDLSPAMLVEATQRGLSGGFAAFSTALPFHDDSFDVSVTVATLHHLETQDRVFGTIIEMARVTRPGGYVLLWDHNPLNPYWSNLMKRVPQDSGDERLVPLEEILNDVAEAGLQTVSVRRLGFVPEFVPRGLMPLAQTAERLVEAVTLLSRLAAHNVVVARKS